MRSFHKICFVYHIECFKISMLLKCSAEIESMSDLSLSKFGIKQSPSFKLDLMLSPSVKNSLKGFQDKLQDQIDEVKHSPSVRRRLKHRRLADLRKTFSVSLDIQCDYFIFPQR